MHRYLLIAIGGAIGSMLRYFIGAQAAQRFGPRFPVGTLFINISACLIIGFSVEFLNRHTDINPAWRFLIPVGFVGGYSTFSTFEWETWMDFTHGAFWVGMLYVAVSLVVGLIAVAAGSALARASA
ncbi:fluoride efflux transporter CrcB [Silvibacterium acidisoli]|uniref:fluoride efflux transporter CrcB n=1 Tax=Acidobacteriaceae bacterium ZG23-2 TaxID=2883246 RepID=UPI00406C56EF